METRGSRNCHSSLSPAYLLLASQIVKRKDKEKEKEEKKDGNKEKD